MAIPDPALTMARAPRPEGRFIETKFRPPSVAGELVALARLDRALAAALERRVVWLSAPAGFGKTTSLLKLARALAADGCTTCWVNLDPEDNETARFLQYVIEAVQRALPGIGEYRLADVCEANVDALKAILRSVCEDLAARATPLALFLDDYHLIDNPAIHAVLAWLLSVSPDCLRVLIASRYRLPSTMDDLRRQQVLADIGTAELSLTLDETACFLHAAQLPALNADQVRTLFERTEGWAAGLQLVAMALQADGRGAAFIDEFSGADCDVSAYLLEAVLSQVPPTVMRFLSLTALFDRFSLALCSEALGQHDAGATMAWIRAHNLFLIALDDGGQWFRYHHLLSDYLRGATAAGAPDQVCLANRAASAWFAREGLRDEAIRCAFQTGDVNLAADLIERCVEDVTQRRGEHDQVIRWYQRLPEETLLERITLRLSYVRSVMWSGRLREAQSALLAIESDLALRYAVSVYDGKDAIDAAILGDLQICWYMFHVFSNRVERVRESKRTWGAQWESTGNPLDIARVKLAAACFAFIEHDYREALALGESAQAFYERCDYYAGVAGCRRMRYVIALERGQAREAERGLAALYEENCRELGRYSIIAANTGIQLADAAYERGQVDLARKVLASAFGMSSKYGLVTNFIAAFLTSSRVLRFDQQGEAADACLSEGLALGRERSLPRLTVALQGERVRVYLQQGRIDDALKVGRGAGIDPAQPGEAGALARSSDLVLIELRLRLATGRLQGLGLAIDDLLVQTRKQQRVRLTVRLLALKSVLLQQTGRMDDACAVLDTAVGLASAGGLCRSIVDEGPEVRAVLEELRRRTPLAAQDGLSSLLSACNFAVASTRAFGAALGAAVISAREVDILKLVQCGLDNRRVAVQMGISEGTAKWYLRNIYQKLQVGSRTAAIARARELRLL
ncbi:LuxR C-terminal-related transcriptional regulator [Massilia scottii]|uniref:LuxR C-terminal-related transcriptional regulator n=1 Tax=Massilia scottii TaxID=3057166 RepID=UPI0027965BEF|nr:LuxR C-terminal-related transcriptional regulator [Massilia sp. CCM 9029]MDQ1832418.1 LuxR C-terminal-related transcriptional regulator [Massilia sp. CCM 9029]